ncbi:MAG: ATP-binding protein [Desulfobulbaceae bacterium]|nr:ATP-binding protein [Desulfobulbaceae bacterium]
MKLFHDKRMTQLFVAAVILAGVFPVLNLYLIYPKYQRQMFESVKHEARQVAHHLARQAKIDNGHMAIRFSREGEPFILQDFGLLKIKVFDHDGKVIYSSEAKDIGTINTHDYFLQAVAKGQEYMKVVVKEEKTLEGEKINRDVVETYVPFMEKGLFFGAFELYFDITRDKEVYNEIYLQSLLYPVPLMIVFILLVGYVLKQLDMKNISQQRDKREIEAQRNSLLIEQEKQAALLSFVEKAKRQWEETMDRVGDIVILADKEMRIKRCNKALSVFCGKSYADILQKRLPEILDGLQIVLDGDNPVSYFHAEHSCWFMVASYPIRQSDGEDGLVVTLHDVTENKRITAELERRNQEILDSSQELQHAIDKISTLIQQVAAEENFGAYFENEFAKACYDVTQCGMVDCPCFGEESTRCWQKVGTFCGGEVQGGFAKKYNSCSECTYFKDMTANPINMIGEQFNNMMHVLEGKNQALHDAYTELKQAQSHILQQEKMASIGQLAAGVAHEINNPVGFISSNLGSLSKYSNRLAEFIALESELLGQVDNAELNARLAEGKKKYKIDFILEDIADLIRESLDGCDRVKKIVQDLKGFSRVDQATRQTVDIHECLDSTINIVWNELKYKAKIDKKYGATLPIACFPQQLNQVFMNLLVNAAHAIEKEGVITIKTWEDEEALFVAISDTGSGIAPENMGHIFEPFFTTKDVGKGTGLGLSIVYDIVTKNHQGDISVDSIVGQGTTFTVKVPFAVV